MKWVLCLAALTGSAAIAQPTAITGATVWTMSGDMPVKDATVLIDHGRILSIKAHGSVPQGAVRIFADHRVITPTLVDAATQIGLSEVGGIDEERRGRVGSGPLGASFEIAYGFNPEDQAVRQARADGVAWAMIYPDGSAPFDGTAALVGLHRQDAAVEKARAAILVTINGSAAARVGGSTAAAWQTLRNALDEVKISKSVSSRHLRDPTINRLDSAALGPVLAGKIPLVIQCDRLSDIRQAIAIGHDYPIKVIIFGGVEAWAAAGALARAKIPVILDPMATLPDTYDRIGARSDSAALLARAGVKLAFSVSAQGIYRSWDAGPSMREGAGLAVASGLSYDAALRAITSNAAEVIGLGPNAGTLKEGGDADLVIWDGDPLEPASAPIMVMIGGENASLVTRQSLLRDRYAPHH